LFVLWAGLKANISEAEHPLLCEGTRRQRGELIIAMLMHYKDDQTKLSRVCCCCCCGPSLFDSVGTYFPVNINDISNVGIIKKY